MGEVCNVCGKTIDRDVYVNASDPPTAEWLGVCACANRKWRWKSATGDPPWELVGAV